MNALLVTTKAINDRPHLDEWFGFLTAYCTGWSKGNAEMIYSAVADDFVWDDPGEELISKDSLKAFLPIFKNRIDRLRTAAPSLCYLTLSDLVVGRNQPTVTVWYCFAVPGTNIQGTSQIRVGNNGVISEHRAYCNSSPLLVAEI